ncbi:MurR/RpiR family transcriptional regulator [Mesorhizobium sp. ZMM04-5]|uniref:MurR/RpiR family transcriptional regulator n=3 Tax=Mesorhizobium marinum TaxID=3228790 RepID=A0ABV3R5C1_9HYPH
MIPPRRNHPPAWRARHRPGLWTRPASRRTVRRYCGARQVNHGLEQRLTEGIQEMSVTPDIIMDIRNIARNGSKVERKIAEVFLSDLHFACSASIAVLADKAGVSEPSITRLCRALNCTGLRDFKLRLAQALAIGEFYLVPPPPSTNSPEERIAAAVCDAAIETIVAVRKDVSMGTIMTAGERLSKARQVYIYGSGGISSLGAIELQNRLFRFSIPAIAHIDGQMQQMTAAVADPDTVTIGISLSGSAPAAVAATEIARRYGARTISIAPGKSPLAQASEINVVFEPREYDNVKKPASVRYGLMAIVDLIAMATIEYLDDASIERMRRVRLTLSELKGRNRYWPLGD